MQTRLVTASQAIPPNRMGGVRMALTVAIGADVLALLKDIAFGGLRTSVGHKLNSVALVLDAVGGQDLAALTTTIG